MSILRIIRVKNSRMKRFVLAILIAMLHAARCLATHDSEEITGRSQCVLSRQMENQCAEYCYKVVKPMLHMAELYHQKDSQIADLRRQLEELKAELAVLKGNQAKNNECSVMAANIVVIKQQMERLSSRPKDNIEMERLSTRQKDNIELKGSIERKAVGSVIQSEQAKRKFSMDAISCGPGLQLIKLPDSVPFQAPCNNHIAGPGWIVVQRRLNGEMNFYRNWTDYSDGFGDLNKEFFIGLKRLHSLTSFYPHELYIHMEHANRDIRYAHYDNFEVGSIFSDYRLISLGNYSGNATDAMRRNVGMKFSTYDRDHDKHIYTNCAKVAEDGWWHSACSDCNLNGIYKSKEQCLFWGLPKTPSDCLKSVHMLIRHKIQN